jgi:hypothetical protein
MTDKLPFTIEILEFEDESPAVLDRVIGGSVYFEEAKRIGQHLCKFARNTDPLRGDIASNSDPP